MLSFSEKFPAFLQARASAMYARAVAISFTEKASLIERLASDPRMDAVWAELTKRERSGYQRTDKYFHPACPPKHAAASLAMDPQPVALEELFCWIVSTVQCSQLSAPPDPARQVVDDLATCLEERFGNAMYGMTSIIASVALDQKITKKMVRSWVLAP